MVFVIFLGAGQRTNLGAVAPASPWQRVCCLKKQQTVGAIK